MSRIIDFLGMGNVIGLYGAICYLTGIFVQKVIGPRLERTEGEHL